MSTGTDLVQHEMSALATIQAAIERPDIDPERLGKMLDVYERLQEAEAKKQFAIAMHACQQKMPKVVKNATNKGTNTKYADLQNVQSIARPIYSSFGFSLCFGEADCPLEKHKRTICDVTHDKGHTRQYHIDLPVDGTGGGGNAIKGMNAVQGCISTTSYGQRRLTCMIFNIVVGDEDDDGQAAEKVSEEQIATINEWLGNTGNDLKGILKYMDVESLADIPAVDFDKCIKALKNLFENRKRQQKSI